MLSLTAQFRLFCGHEIHDIDPLHVNRPFRSSVLWVCWLGYTVCKIVPKMM